MLTIRVHAGVEQRGALRVFDQIGRDRQVDLPLAPFHQAAELTPQGAAGEGIEVHAHRRPRYPAAVGMRLASSNRSRLRSRS